MVAPVVVKPKSLNPTNGIEKSSDIAEAIIVPESISLPGKLTILFTINDLMGPSGVPPNFVKTGKIQKIGFQSKGLNDAIVLKHSKPWALGEPVQPTGQENWGNSRTVFLLTGSAKRWYFKSQTLIAH